MFDESKHPRDNDGKFTSSDGAGGTHEATEAEKQRLRERGIRDGGGETKKLTPAEKIASVHIDFTKDNILPELEETSLRKMGVQESKPVIVKASTIARNGSVHQDVDPKDVDKLIGETLYAPEEVVAGKNPNKPYFAFIKKIRISEKSGKTDYGTVLLDVTADNDNFEVVHWHWVREKI